MTIEEKKKKKGDRCVRIAKRKYDVWPCVPMYSEALTKTGWKSYKDVKVGDTILAYDPDSDTLKWTLIKNLHFYEKAKTIKMDKQHFEITSTPDHKWVTYNKNSGFKKTVNEQKLSKILETINEVNDGKITKKEAQVKLPAFFHYYKNYNGKTQEEIIKQGRISKGGIDFTKTKNLKRSMCILTAARLDNCYKPLQIESISKYGDNWVEKILNMSADQIDAFFASAIIYDGNQKTDLLLEKNTGMRKTENTYGFKQKDEMHGDIFELAAFLSGRNVTRGKKNQYGITSFYVREKRYIPLDVMRFSEDEDQDVWCPETEFGTWVMRQNNRILITGNSAYASGAVVKCRQGKIWKGIKEVEEIEGEDSPEEPNILDLSKELDSGFCEFNPLINKFAQYSPENLAEMLIFVIATQQQRWYDVVPKFPLLMSYVKKNNTLLDPEKASTNEKGKLVYELPKSFSQLTLGFRKNAIQWVWDNKGSIYSDMKPLFNQFNNSGEDSIAKEEAIFKIYLELIKVKGLGLPKAAFASQLIIGRLGCIDSINLNLYKGLDKKGELIIYDKKKGTPNFKTPGTSIDKKTGIMQVSKGGIKLAEKYVQFLKHIAELTKSSEAQISQKLWDSWCELVALKINKTGDIKVKMPGGQEFTVPNDYSKNIKRTETNPAAKFRKDYIGKISARDISRQHHPEKMFEGYEKWSKYIKNLIIEQIINEVIDEELDEAAYKGNMGAMEVFKFLQEAPPEEVEQFDDLLKQDKEQKAWDLVKKFTRVELVDIGTPGSSGSIEEKKKPDFQKEKESGLHGWFSRQGGKGKSKGWVDCNTCRTDKKTGKKTCKTCGRKEGEKRSKYPACRPKPSDCGSSGKGKDWGKRSSKKESLQIDEELVVLIEDMIKEILNEN